MSASSFNYIVGEGVQVLFELRSLVPMSPEGYAATWDVRVILPNVALGTTCVIPTDDHPRQSHADEIVERILASMN